MTFGLSAFLLAGLFIACYLELSRGYDRENTTQCSSATANTAANQSNTTMPKDEFDWETEYQKFIYRALNRTNLTIQEFHNALRHKTETFFPAQNINTTQEQKVGLQPLHESKKDEYTRPDTTVDSERNVENWSSYPSDPPSKTDEYTRPDTTVDSERNVENWSSYPSDPPSKTDEYTRPDTTVDSERNVENWSSYPSDPPSKTDEYTRLDTTVDSERNVENWSSYPSDPPSAIKFETEHIIAGGKTLHASDLEPLEQWHVGIYSKAFEPYMQICGGSLVTTKAVISAAHCFWSESDGGVMPASQFGVAAGKLYRPWNEKLDYDSQHSDISAIHVPKRFRGAAASFQDDIAVLLLAKAFTISAAIRPLCVSFDEDLESDLLQSGNEGLIVGWGLTEEDGTPAQTLQYLYMPYVPVEECISTAEPGFLKYITSDKICAGVTTGKALCRGDSGGGFVFFDLSYGGIIPYLYGVASTAPRNAHRCNTLARAALTSVTAHRAFLRTHIPNIEDSCSEYYDFSRTLKPGIENKVTGPVCNCNCFYNCNNSTTP